MITLTDTCVAKLHKLEAEELGFILEISGWVHIGMDNLDDAYNADEDQVVAFQVYKLETGYKVHTLYKHNFEDGEGDEITTHKDLESVCKQIRPFMFNTICWG